MLNVVFFGMEEALLCRIEEELAAFAGRQEIDLVSIRVNEGGSRALHMRFGEGAGERVPVIPEGQADILCGFDPGMGLKHLSYLKRKGIFVLLIEKKPREQERAEKGRGEKVGPEAVGERRIRFCTAKFSAGAGGFSASRRNNGYHPEACLDFLRRRVHHVLICPVRPAAFLESFVRKV
jgi:hypothetical protein